MRFSLGNIFKGDRSLWIVMVLLSLISMLIVYSATGKLAFREAGGDTSHYLVRQSIFILTGLTIMVILVNFIPVKLYFLISPALIGITLFTLVAAYVQFKIQHKPTPRSLDVGFFNFQPADLAKISLVMYAARILSKYQKTKEDLWFAFKRVTIVSGVICAIIFMGNVSTSVLIFASMMVLMMIARIPMKYLSGLIGAGILFVTLVYFTANIMPKGFGRVHTFKERIDDFLYGDKEAEKGTTQADFAKLAIFEGGTFGKGPGNSEVSNYMEAGYNDFIFAIIVEEYGLVGGTILVFLYLVLLYRGVVIVRRSERTFPAFLVAGLVIMVVFQAVINMSVSAGVIPVTGQPLPWVSMGGTSMLFTAVGFGAILSVSYYNKKIKASQDSGQSEVAVAEVPVEDQDL